MTEVTDSLQLTVFARIYEKYQNDTVGLLELLATTLELALKTRVQVSRGGWPWSKVKPVEKIEVSFDDLVVEISKKKHGGLLVMARKIVRGITLKTSEITVADCIKEISTRVEAIAETSESARDALRNFTLG